jgi:predicted nucleic acid-binding Zn ribbon protein
MTGPTRRGGDHRGDRDDDVRAARRVADGQGDKPRGLERLADLLPNAARQFGLEDQLQQALAAAAWSEIVADRIPAAAGACRLVALSQGVAAIETDEPIVAQELRLRSPELLAALRAATRAPIRQLRVTARHV